MKIKTSEAFDGQTGMLRHTMKYIEAGGFLLGYRRGAHRPRIHVVPEQFEITNFTGFAMRWFGNRALQIGLFA